MPRTIPTIALALTIALLTPFVAKSAVSDKGSLLTLEDVMDFKYYINTECPVSEFKDHKAINRAMKDLGARSVAGPWTLYVYEGSGDEGPIYTPVKGTRVVYLLYDAQINYAYGTYNGSETSQLSIEFDNETALIKFIDSATEWGYAPFDEGDDSLDTWIKKYNICGIGYVMVVDGLNVTFYPNVG